MKLTATNIIWDTDDEPVDLPTSIEIPKDVTDEDDISDYLSELTSFCHKGFVLKHN